jgi:hypothetical protein
LLVMAFAAAGALAAVDQGLLNLMMPDAKFVAGMQVEAAKSSSFGQFVLREIQVEEGFTKFVAETGFDPRRDLAEIVAASSGDSKIGGLIAGRGFFNPVKIMAAARAHGAAVASYRGVDVAAYTGGNGKGGFAFPDAQTVVLGDLDAVRAALDRRLGSGPRLPAGMAAKAVAAAAKNDAWFVTLAPLAELFAATTSPQLQSGAMFQAVTEASGGVRFIGGTLEINGEAISRTDRDAQALSDVLRFLGSMIVSQDGSGTAQKLMQGFTVTQEGNATRLKLTIAEDTLEELFLGGPRKAKVAADRR